MTFPPAIKDLEQQRIDYCPWFYPGAGAAEKRAQEKHQKRLEAVRGAVIGRRCYISPEAVVAGELSLGDDSFIAAQAYLTGRVRLGRHCSINPFASVRENVTGGDGIRIGAYACLVGANHGFADTERPIHRQPHTSRGIVLGDDIWIGSHVMIVDGVTVGSHSILAAGAVVTKDVPAYAIVGGNPARVIRMRERPRPKVRTLAARLETFGAMVAGQLDRVVARYEDRTTDGALCYVDREGARKRTRPWCDAVELYAMFGSIPPGRTRAQWVTCLRDFQDRVTGLVPEHLPEDREHDAPPAKRPEDDRYYNTMIVNYALECLGSNLPVPVAAVASITERRLLRKLASLPWKTGAWGAGDWVDCYASCLLPNRKYFGRDIPLVALMRWLDRHCDPKTGMWGSRNRKDRWLLPVNGFYRLTRGTYAQYGLPLPHPERSLDTILRHGRDAAFFAPGTGNACNVLDVVHPLWLCLKQTGHRRAEAEAWVEARIEWAMKCWIRNRGFSFDLAKKEPGLQGTEMWLSIIWLMADLLGVSGRLGYRPRGVHRPEAASSLEGK